MILVKTWTATFCSCRYFGLSVGTAKPEEATVNESGIALIAATHKGKARLNGGAGSASSAKPDVQVRWFFIGS
jgi:hypothetical protein